MPSVLTCLMNDVNKLVHKAARVSLAWLFWLHSLGITHLLRSVAYPKLLDRRLLLEVLLLAVILFYSLIAQYGWFSLVLDLMYIYVFPVWMILKYGWKMSKGPATGVLRLISPTFASSAEEKKAKPARQSADPETGLMPRLLRPFQQFAVLWCAVILLADNRLLIVAASAAVAIAAVRSIGSLTTLLNWPMNWLERFRERLGASLEKLCQTILTTDPSAKEFASNAAVIRFYRGVLAQLSNNDYMERRVRPLSLIIAVPYYVYISILSGFTYLGIAHFYRLDWPLSQALVDAVFMPFAWTELPHIALIRILGGIQGAALILIGYEAIFNRMSQKAERILAAANDLSQALQRPEVEARIILLDQRTPEGVQPQAQGVMPKSEV